MFINQIKNIFNIPSIKASLQFGLVLAIICFTAHTTQSLENSFLNATFHLLSACLIFLLAFSLKLPKSLSLLLALGWLLRAIYFTKTAWDFRSYDWWGHMDYLQIILWGGKLYIPHSGDCWACYHPPFYYLLGAMFFKCLSPFFGQSEKIYQLFSLICSMLTSFYAVFIFKQVFDKPKLQLLASALVIFWPLEIISSARIGNDALLMTLYIMAMFYMLKWLNESTKLKFILIASGLALAAYLTKANGSLIMLVLIFSYLLIALRGDFKGNYLKPILLGCLIMGIFASAIFVSAERSKHDFGTYKLIGNRVDDNLIVANRPENFIYFDLKTFLTKPFTSSRDDELGRKYFWNYLLKTSLFGEFSFKEQTELAATSLSSLLLLMIAFSACAFMLRQNGESIISGIFLVNFVLLLSAILYLRMTLSYSCAGDFRYISPMILSFSYFIVRGIEDFRSNGLNRLANLNCIFGVVFCLSTIVFFVCEFLYS